MNLREQSERLAELSEELRLDLDIPGGEAEDARRRIMAVLTKAIRPWRGAAQHALEFLDDLAASDNPACDPENPQAAGFHMVRQGLAALLAPDPEHPISPKWRGRPSGGNAVRGLEPAKKTYCGHDWPGERGLPPDPEPKLHPRTLTVQKASIEIREAIGAAVGKHELTYAEVFRIHAESLSDWAKYAIRDERGVERGDEAPDPEPVQAPDVSTREEAALGFERESFVEAARRLKMLPLGHDFVPCLDCDPPRCTHDGCIQLETAHRATGEEKPQKST